MVYRFLFVFLSLALGSWLWFVAMYVENFSNSGKKPVSLPLVYY